MTLLMAYRRRQQTFWHQAILVSLYLLLHQEVLPRCRPVDIEGTVRALHNDACSKDEAACR